MSPALIHDRVDRWLASRESWINANIDRVALVEAWHECAVKYGADHPAALGCLLAILREAWGGESVSVLVIHCGPTYDAVHECSISTEIGDVRERFLGLSEDGFNNVLAMALVAALEAAPCSA